MLQYLQLKQINLRFLDIAVPGQIIDAFRCIPIVLEFGLVLFGAFFGVGLVFLVHLLELCVVFCLF